MRRSSALTDALDLLVDRLERVGSPVRGALRPARSRAAVARHFEDLGLHVTAELVDLFSWHDGVDGATLFWETDFHPLAEATDVWRFSHALAAEEGDLELAASGRSWPGPFEWFPALHLDDSELLVVDNGDHDDRGAVWFTFTQDRPHRLFDSLLEGVLAAIWCVETGLWRVDDAGRIRCDRSHMPWEHDREHPPWCAEHHDPAGRRAG